MKEILRSDILSVSIKGNVLFVECSKRWTFQSRSIEFYSKITTSITCVIVKIENVQQMTSPLLVFLKDLKRWAQSKRAIFEIKNPPDSLQKIFKLAQAPTHLTARSTKPSNFIYRIGQKSIDCYIALKNGLVFFITLIQSLSKAYIARPKNMENNLLPFLQQTGSNALPIVALISALVGLIMAFVSVVQLERFGASIYVADLVALAMTREMGCLMTGVIMAGRTGAAFAASIGSMRVNEELDALQTFGINRMAYLVVPRVIALALMMPLLCIFADLIGILGGMFSALPFTKGSLTQYLLQTKKALAIGDILIGLLKSVSFGVIIAAIGCYKGMNCGRNATAVGEATTSAVVQGITWIIVADALFALLFTTLKI
jgi:phospholipid/cholesterol/gamma-HCH transport system permease protein